MPSWPQRKGIARLLQQWQQTTGQAPGNSSRFPEFNGWMEKGPSERNIFRGEAIFRVVIYYKSILILKYYENQGGTHKTNIYNIYIYIMYNVNI